MSSYLNTHGQPTTANDPQRMMWYSSQCSYWTDDWDNLKKFGPGIPCCPHCGCPGMQTMVLHWNNGASELDKEEPGYISFLQDVKEKCYGKGVSIGKLWERVRASSNSEMDKALNDAVKELSKNQSK
jgi:hypothetical protein